jgi:hypothetical protein
MEKKDAHTKFIPRRDAGWDWLGVESSLPLCKNQGVSSSVGILTFPTQWKVIKKIPWFQSTNQYSINMLITAQLVIQRDERQEKCGFTPTTFGDRMGM